MKTFVVVLTDTDDARPPQEEGLYRDRRRLSIAIRFGGGRGGLYLGSKGGSSGHGYASAGLSIRLRRILRHSRFAGPLQRNSMAMVTRMNRK